LDGGVGSFLLLGPLQGAERVILIDATIDGRKTGSVRRLRPKFSTDYPTTLTAHDIGLKDLLDAFYLMGTVPEVVLYAISISDIQDMVMDLTPELRPVVSKVAKMVTAEATIPPTALRSSQICA
jgi:hydrogenase maturation protease